jgi:hypothetical protein
MPFKGNGNASGAVDGCVDVVIVLAQFCVDLSAGLPLGLRTGKTITAVPGMTF